MAARRSNLQIQNLDVDDVALLTLNSLVALDLNTEWTTTVENSFLLRKYKCWIEISGMTAGEGPLLVGLAKGDTSVGEIANALVELNAIGPQDTTQVLAEDDIWVILQNTVRKVNHLGSSGVRELEVEMSFGPKGFPSQEGQGIKVFIYNADGSDLSTGGVVKGLIQLWGVWLRD